MVLVLSGNDDHIGKFGLAQHIFPGGEAHILGDVMQLSHIVPGLGNGIGHGDNTEIVISCHQVSVAAATAAGANKDYIQCLIHDNRTSKFQLIFFCFYIGNKSETLKKAISYVAMVINVVMYAAPGEKLLTVIKTNNYKLLPIASSVAAFFNSLSWFMFGLLKGEVGIIVPNVLGMALAVMQLGVFWYAYVKFKKDGIIEAEGNDGLNVDGVDTPIVEE
jgi:hypothetical protein